MPQPITTKFWSTLEPVSIIIALLIALSVFALCKTSLTYKMYASTSTGIVSLLVVLYITHYTFEICGDRVTYGTLFWSKSISLTDILEVSAHRPPSIFLGTIIRFSLTPVEIKGQIKGRSELVSLGRWPLPDTKGWMEGVNALAAEKRRHVEP